MAVLFHTSAVTPEDSVTAARSAAKDFTARLNRRYQEGLVDQLVEAREAVGKSIAEVAAYLGIEVDLVEEVEAGEYELNLTELRQWALAVEVVIEIRVHNRAFDRPGFIVDDIRDNLPGYWTAWQRRGSWVIGNGNTVDIPWAPFPAQSINPDGQ